MAGGVDVNIGADTRDFERSVKAGMQRPVEDAQQALEDYVKAADDSGSSLTDTFTAQQRSTTDLKRDLDELNRSIRDAPAASYRKAGDAGDTFKRRTSEGFDEIKESARSNAIEVGASFTGGFDQAAGGLQGFVAEFLAGFGPAGVLAGVGAAAILGTITQAVDDGQQAAEAQKAAVAELAGEYIEAGHAGKRSFDSVADSISAMATSDGSDVVITLQKAWDLAKASGGDYQDIVEAIASGSPSEIGKARRAVEQLDGAHRQAGNSALSGARAAVQANGREANAVDGLRDALGKAAGQATAAGRAQQLAARAGMSDLRLKQDLIGQLEGAYDDAAGSVDDFIKHNKFDASGYVKNVDRMRDALIKYKDALAESDLSPAAKKYLESQGAEQAAAMLRGYEGANRTTKARLNEIWSTSGKENVDRMRDALIKYKDALAESDLSPAAKKYLESQGAEQAAAMLRGYEGANRTTKARLNEIWSTSGKENATNYGDALGRDLSSINLKPVKIPVSIVPPPDTSALDRFASTPYVKRIVLEGVTRDGKRVF